MNKLIVNKSKYNYSEIIKRAEGELLELVGEKRKEHTLAVLSLAVYLAEIFKKLGADIDTDEVRCAALLHDVAKNMDAKSVCEKYGVVLSEDDLGSPQTIHAVAGAYYAKEAYGVSDSVFSAILKHTVGSDEMSLVDNIVFVSDYCEETRVHEECLKTRSKLLKICEISEDSMSEGEDGKVLADAILHLEYIKCEILFKTVKYLSERGDKIHSGTVLTLKSVFGKHREKEQFKALGQEYSDVVRDFDL